MIACGQHRNVWHTHWIAIDAAGIVRVEMMGRWPENGLKNDPK